VGGYLLIDKKKTTPVGGVITVLARKGRRNKSAVVMEDGVYYSRTRSKKIAERINGSEEKD
jgi:hypothetical protein